MRLTAFWRGATLLAAACVAAFGRTVTHGFLLWDDRAFIADNPLIAHPSAATLVTLWTRPHLDLYAPLTYTLWAGVAALAGPAAWAYHLTNVALHGLAAWAVFALLRDLGGRGSEAGALAGALLFAVHPLQTEAVAWASETKDLLSALFALAAIRAYLLFRERGDRRVYVAASIAFACALLAKPSAVATPAIVLVLERTLRRRSWGDSLGWLGPWFLGAAAFAAASAIIQPASDVLPWVPPLWLRPAVALDTLGFYVRKLVFPLDLVPDYGRTSQSLASTGALAYGWAPAAGVIALAGWLRRSAPWLGVAVAVFVAALLPVLGLVPFDFQYYSNVADHYVYLAMLGPALGLALAFPALPPAARRVAVPVALAGLLVLTIRQASIWKDDPTLYARTLAANPASIMAHNNTGQMLEERGELEQALVQYQKALDLDPGNASALNNVGNVLFKQGRYDEAIQHYTAVLGLGQIPERQPKTRIFAARMHNNLGAAYLKKARYRDAVGEFQRASALDPDYLEPCYNLGIVLMEFGRYGDAIEAFRKGLAIDPHHSALRAQLEVALSRAGR